MSEDLPNSENRVRLLENGAVKVEYKPGAKFAHQRFVRHVKKVFEKASFPFVLQHSFGIHVAKMAGVPKSVIKNANKILLNLEKDRGQDKISNKISENNQLDFFTIQDPISQEIKLELMKIDLDKLTPIEALVILNDLKRKAYNS